MAVEIFAEEDALAREAADPSRRADFRVPPWPGAPGAEWAYFAGNSLGLQPRGAAPAVADELEAWAELAVEAWFEGREPWLTASDELRPALARLVGAAVEEVVAMNTLTVNLHLLMATFYRPAPERHRIVIEDAAFPSDSHAVASQVRQHGYDPATAVVRLQPRAGEAALRTEDVVAELERLRGSVALVLLGGVNYLTGELVEIPQVTSAGHDIGAVVGWDLAHAVGNVPLELSAWDVDWAAWCHYKYVNAGPGAPAGAFVHARHANDASLPRLAGWWGNDPATRFRMEPGFVPRAGAVGWQISTPPVLAFAPLRASLALFDAVGMPALRARSLRLTGYLESLLDAVVAERRAALLTPRDEARRGCQLSLSVPDARTLAARLRAEHGVICDVREPDVIRLAPAPLYSSYHDCWRAATALRELVPGLVTRAEPSAVVSYGAHAEQVAELWLPAGDGPHAGVVLVHGGCWREEYRRDLEHRMAADFVARGLAVWNVEYRRLDCDGDWPAPLDDVVAAAEALPAKIDRERVALAGHSAGGQLAMLAANRFRVRGVLAQAPVSDLPLAAEMGACAGAIDRVIAQGAPSPIDQPPEVEMLLVHGDADQSVPVELSRRYAAGGHAVYVEIVGCGHLEHLDPGSEAGRLAGNWLERLLV